MAKTIALLLPSTGERLRRLGERLRLARLRRRLTAKQVAERAGMTPMTLRSLERGGAGVTMGAYLAVMQVLGLEQDLDQLAAADPLGRELQDASLQARSKAPAPATPSAARPQRRKHSTTGPATVQSTEAVPLPSKKPTKSSDGSRRWLEKSGFTSSHALAELIDPLPPRAKKRR